MNLFVRQAVRGREASELFIQHPSDPAPVGADPKGAVRGGDDRPDVVVRQPLFNPEVLYEAPIEPVQSMIRTEPHSSATILRHRQYSPIAKICPICELLYNLGSNHLPDSRWTEASPHVVVSIDKHGMCRRDQFRFGCERRRM